MSSVSRFANRNTVATTLTLILLALAFCVSAHAQSVQPPWKGNYVHKNPRKQTDLGECGYRAYHICRDRCPKTARGTHEENCIESCGQRYLCGGPK